MAKQKKGKGSGGKGKGKNPTPPSNSSSNGNGGKTSRRKNKWQQANSVDDDFRDSLLNQGNTIKEMKEDGNCLFRSLSDQLYHDSGAKHDIVRHDVCNHLSENKEGVKLFEVKYFLSLTTSY